MRWEGNRQSDNVRDARGRGGGGFGGLPIGGGGLSIGGVVIALVIGWVFGINPLALLGMMGGGAGGAAPSAQVQPDASPTSAQDDPAKAFVKTVLADTEDVWGKVFREAGSTYKEPGLVLFDNPVQTACGTGHSAMGPFYCPGDEQVYIDLRFYDVLKQRLGAPGDFAQAYVIAHEVGHHVQNLMGITGKVDAMRGRASERQINAMSVRVELQADCFAGMWARQADQARAILEQGDLEEALNAASKIGDDALQSGQGGAVRPDSFTHGTSEQRVRWFKRGFESGDVQACDTFNTQTL